MASHTQNGDSDEELQEESVALTMPNSLPSNSVNLFDCIIDGNTETLKAMLHRLTPEARKNALNGLTQSQDPLHVSYTPLQLACCMGNRNIFSFLLSQGAHISVANKHGKNIIHMLVDISKYKPKMAVDMYNFVMQSCSLPDKKELLNGRFEKHTPHVYAVKNGNLPMADTIIRTNDVYRHVMNRCGTYDVVRYDLHIEGSDSHECPIRALLHLGLNQVKTPSNRDVITRRPWATWLSQCWADYVWIAFLWFLGRLTHLVLLTICCLQRPYRMRKMGATEVNGTSNTSTYYYSLNQGSVSMVKVSVYILLVLAVGAIVPNIYRLCQPSNCRRIRNVFVYYVKDVYKTVQRIKRPRETHLTQGRLFWVLSIAMHISYILSFAFAYYELPYEDVTLSLCVVLCYISMLFFCTMIPQLGHFSIIIEQTVKDILNFALFYLFILLGFSAAFYTLYQMEDQVEDFKSYPRTVFTVFHMTFDVIGMDTLQKARAPAAAIVCFIIYVVIVIVALLNFLIAILSQTVGDITESRHIAFSMNRASVAFFLQEYPFVRLLRTALMKIVCCGKHKAKGGLCSVFIVEHLSEGGDIDNSATYGRSDSVL